MNAFWRPSNRSHTFSHMPAVTLVFSSQIFCFRAVLVSYFFLFAYIFYSPDCSTLSFMTPAWSLVLLVLAFMSHMWFTTHASPMLCVLSSLKQSLRTSRLYSQISKSFTLSGRIYLSICIQCVYSVKTANWQWRRWNGLFSALMLLMHSIFLSSLLCL